MKTYFADIEHSEFCKLPWRTFILQHKVDDDGVKQYRVACQSCGQAGETVPEGELAEIWPSSEPTVAMTDEGWMIGI